jgi:hypothetical protein
VGDVTFRALFHLNLSSSPTSSLEDKYDSMWNKACNQLNRHSRSKFARPEKKFAHPEKKLSLSKDERILS